MPLKAIIKEDVFSTFKKGYLYAKKHELVEVAEIRDNVAIVIKQNGDWFPVNIKKLIIQE
jgi:hypothetical protein